MCFKQHLQSSRFLTGTNKIFQHMLLSEVFLNENTHTYHPFLHINHTQDFHTLADTLPEACKRLFYKAHNSLGQLCSECYQTCIANAAGHLLRVENVLRQEGGELA